MEELKLCDQRDQVIRRGEPQEAKPSFSQVILIDADATASSATVPSATTSPSPMIDVATNMVELSVFGETARQRN